MSSFTGFPKAGVAWFQGLAMAQNREWFHAHRDGYQQLWLAPINALVAEVTAPLAKLYGKKIAPAKIFRLNRDVRFAKDKSPYKTNAGVLLYFEGYPAMEGPAALYFHLGMDEEVAFGFYMLEPAGLQRLRKAIVDEKTGPALQKLIDAAGKHGLTPMSIEQLKRAPVGVDPAHPRIALLKHKGLALSATSVPKKVRYGAEFKDWVLAQAEAAAPVVKWGFAQKLA